VRGERNLFQLCRLSNLLLPDPFSGSEWRICSTEKREQIEKKEDVGPRKQGPTQERSEGNPTWLVIIFTELY